MKLSDIKKNSNDNLNASITFNPVMPDGSESDLELTIFSARNDDLADEIVSLTRKGKKIAHQMQKAQGDSILRLKKQQENVEKSLAFALLDSFDNLYDEETKVPVTDDSKRMLVDVFWIREEIIEKSAETGEFMGKSSNNCTNKQKDTSVSENQMIKASRN